MKTSNIYIAIICIFSFTACKKELNQQGQLNPTGIPIIARQPALSMNAVQENEQIFREGELVIKCRYLGQTNDNSNPDNPTNTRSVRVDLTRPAGLMQRPTWKYFNGTPWLAVAMASAAGYEVENLDGPTSFMTFVQNEPKIHRESNLVSTVTYLGETQDNSIPNSSTKTRRIQIDLTRPNGLIQYVTWIYNDWTPDWAIWAANRVEYPTKKI